MTGRPASTVQTGQTTLARAPNAKVGLGVVVYERRLAFYCAQGAYLVGISSIVIIDRAVSVSVKGSGRCF